MEFIEYRHIDNIKTGYVFHGEYVAMEKLDGANMTVACNGGPVEFWRRHGKIEDSDPSFPIADITPGLGECMRKLQANVTGRLRVVGELVGTRHGALPYTVVPKQFIAFELYVDDTPLPYDEFVERAGGAGFTTTPIVCRGPFDECAAVDVETLQSKVADGQAEGIVLRAVGSAHRWKKKRVGRADCRPSTKSAPRPVPPMTAAAKEWAVSVAEYIHVGTVGNVLSHQHAAGAQLIGLVVQDATSTWYREHDGVQRPTFSSAEKKRVQTHLTEYAKTAVSEYAADA